MLAFTRLITISYQDRFSSNDYHICIGTPRKLIKFYMKTLGLVRRNELTSNAGSSLILSWINVE